jgi:hypothetical protein
MNAAPQEVKHGGVELLTAHLESLDPRAFTARERLEMQLGDELARKLVSALATRPPYRRAACLAA